MSEKVLGVVIILFVSLQLVSFVEARTYENSWVVFTGFSWSKTIYGRQDVQYSFPDLVRAGEMVTVTVWIEYVDDENAKLEYVKLLEVNVGIRTEPNATSEISIDTDLSVPRLYKGEKYVHVFQVETLDPGTYYVVLFWREKWSDGSEFTTEDFD